MGPNHDVLNEVKKDAIRHTLRHFRDQVEDSEFEPVKNLGEVQKKLLAEHDQDALERDHPVIEQAKKDNKNTKASK